MAEYFWLYLITFVKMVMFLPLYVNFVC